MPVLCWSRSCYSYAASASTSPLGSAGWRWRFWHDERKEVLFFSSQRHVVPYRWSNSATKCCDVKKLIFDAYSAFC